MFYCFYKIIHPNPWICQHDWRWEGQKLKVSSAKQQMNHRYRLAYLAGGLGWGVRRVNWIRTATILNEIGSTSPPSLIFLPHSQISLHQLGQDGGDYYPMTLLVPHPKPPATQATQRLVKKQNARKEINTLPSIWIVFNKILFCRELRNNHYTRFSSH